MLAALLLAAAWNLQAAPPAPPPITATGCIAQAPDNIAAPPTGHEQEAAKGLTLTRATMKAPDRRVDQSFWLVGAKAPELLRYVGRRAEITGTIDDKLAANPGGQPVNPLAPTRAISVSTFRVLTEGCS
jgi:hypothetical protein